MAKKNWVLLLVLALIGMVGFAVVGCGKAVDTTNTPTGQTYSIINGTVKDLTGNAISDVTVTTSATTAATNTQGYFSISNLSTTREVVAFSKTGKMTVLKVAALTPGQATFLDVVMVPANAAQAFDATTGGTFSGDSVTGLTASVSLPASALTTLSASGVRTLAVGAANIAITPFDPTTSPEAFPCGYTGISSNGAVVPFESFGFINVIITDTSGNPLELGSGKTAIIKLEVPSSMYARAAVIGTIPLWFINSNGQWQEEGTATWDGVNSFVGTVAHFSSWNCDMPYSTAYITGKVVDSNGNLVQGAEVRTQATDNTWSNSGYYSRSDGTFGPIPVQAGVSFIVFATRGGMRSANYTEGPFAVGTTNDIGNIVLTAPLIQITLTWGLDPDDLDSHLTIPPSIEGNPRYDVFFNNIGSTPSDRWPSANLDTDDTTSFGPEITSVYELYKGVYRFSIHHYDGIGTISTSEAVVNLIVSGGGMNAIYNFTPPAGATDVKDVWGVFDLTVDNSGNITDITPLNTMDHHISADNHNAFSPGSSETTATAYSGMAVQMIKK